MLKTGTVEMLELRRMNVRLSFISLLMPQIIWKAGLLKHGQARLHNSNKETQHKRIGLI